VLFAVVFVDAVVRGGGAFVIVGKAFVVVVVVVAAAVAVVAAVDFVPVVVAAVVVPVVVAAVVVVPVAAVSLVPAEDFASSYSLVVALLPPGFGSSAKFGVGFDLSFECWYWQDWWNYWDD